MQRGKKPRTEKKTFDATKTNPFMSNLLNGLFFLQVPWIFASCLAADEDKKTVGLYTVAGMAFVFLSDFLSQHVGGFFSRTLLKSSPFDDPLSTPKTMTKFKSQMWQTIVHTCMFLTELTIIGQLKEGGEDLIHDHHLAADLLAPNPDLLHTLYLLQMAIWIVTAVHHIFVAEKQSDYLVMLGHHIATLTIIGISYKFGFLRYGLIILIIHDGSDILVDLLKTFNYLKLEGPRGFFLTELCFVGNLITWAYARLWHFPRFVYYGNVKSIEAWGPLAYDWWDFKEGSGFASVGSAYNTKVQEGFLKHHENIGEGLQHSIKLAVIGTGVTAILYVMHLYWFALFLRIAVRLIKGEEETHDIGADEYMGDSDEDGDDEGKDKDKEKSGSKKKN